VIFSSGFDIEMLLGSHWLFLFFFRKFSPRETLIGSLSGAFAGGVIGPDLRGPRERHPTSRDSRAGTSAGSPEAPYLQLECTFDPLPPTLFYIPGVAFRSLEVQQRLMPRLTIASVAPSSSPSNPADQFIPPRSPMSKPLFFGLSLMSCDRTFSQRPFLLAQSRRGCLLVSCGLAADSHDNARSLPSRLLHRKGHGPRLSRIQTL